MSRFTINHIFPLLIAILLVGCNQGDNTPRNPWGSSNNDSISSSGSLSLDDIISNGELIMVTISGPDTYYDYHGRGMGLHYLLCEQFCQHIGVALRVDVCKDTLEMVDRIKKGEADVIAMPMTIDEDGLMACAEKASDNKWHWLVNQDNTSLAGAIDEYFKPDMLAQTTKTEHYRLSTASVVRHVYSPYVNRAKGEISNYDNLFQRYAPQAGWDWRLMAAQCYQESTFDPHAHSWAGASGLMQIMPSVASSYGLSGQMIYDPETNVSTSARIIAQLMNSYSDIPDKMERIKFVLASYNAGSAHIRDAMALARKYGGSPHNWTSVSEYVLRLQESRYYTDPIVKHGYMRGTETVNYVSRIIGRWMNYQGLKGEDMPSPDNYDNDYSTPQPSYKPRKAKYQL